MSTGRKSIALEDLQDILQAAYATGRLEQAVAERRGAPAPRRISAEELTAAPDEGLSRPSDAQFSLSRQEFRAEVRRAVKVRLREYAEVVDMVLSDKPVPPGHYVRPEVVASVQIAAAEEAAKLRATLPPEKPWRRPTRTRMPLRKDVAASEVVLRDRFGGSYDPETNRPLTQAEAEFRLTPPERKSMGWAAQR